jgi:hypothetical protein
MSSELFITEAILRFELFYTLFSPKSFRFLINQCNVTDNQYSYLNSILPLY